MTERTPAIRILYLLTGPIVAQKVYEQWWVQSMRSLNWYVAGTDGRLFCNLIFPWQSGSCKSPSDLLQVFVSIRPTILVPLWLVCHLSRISKKGQIYLYVGSAKFNKLLVKGLHPHDHWPGALQLPYSPQNKSTSKILDPPMQYITKNRVNNKLTCFFLIMFRIHFCQHCHWYELFTPGFIIIASKN